MPKSHEVYIRHINDEIRFLQGLLEGEIPEKSTNE